MWFLPEPRVDALAECSDDDGRGGREGRLEVADSEEATGAVELIPFRAVALVRKAIWDPGYSWNSAKGKFRGCKAAGHHSVEMVSKYPGSADRRATAPREDRISLSLLSAGCLCRRHAYVKM